MFKKYRITVLLLIFIITACFLFIADSLVGVEAAQSPSAGVSVVNALETWNLGITVEGSPAYNLVIGRLVSDVGAFRSARATEEATIFPAPASARTIQSAQFYLLSRTGSYPGMTTMSLAVFNFAGTLMHSVSALNIDLQATPIGTWTPITLSSNPDDLVISPGEFLAFYFTMSGPSTGDLVIRPMFEVNVR